MRKIAIWLCTLATASLIYLVGYHFGPTGRDAISPTFARPKSSQLVEFFSKNPELKDPKSPLTAEEALLPNKIPKSEYKELGLDSCLATVKRAHVKLSQRDDKTYRDVSDQTAFYGHRWNQFLQADPKSYRIVWAGRTKRKTRLIILKLESSTAIAYLPTNSGPFPYIGVKDTMPTCESSIAEAIF